MNKRTVGAEYEKIACKKLEQEGMRIIETNFRVRIGEIDIIAWDYDTLVFVEVKYRKNKEYGGADYAIPYKKQKIIGRVAQWYMSFKHINMNTICRFDAVLINGDEITHIKNAW